MSAALVGHELVLGYARSTVVHGVSVGLEAGVVTALIGPNASSKSTVLRSLARLHPVTSGAVELAGADSDSLSARAFAHRVTLLSQSRPHPSGLTVHDVVAFGRHPHRRRFAALTESDRQSMAHAMQLTGTTAMAERLTRENSRAGRAVPRDHDVDAPAAPWT